MFFIKNFILLIIERFNNKYENFVQDNLNISDAIEVIESIIKDYYVFVSCSTDQYVQGHRQKRRVYFTTLSNMATLICGLRMGLAAVIDKVKKIFTS